MRYLLELLIYLPLLLESWNKLIKLFTNFWVKQVIFWHANLLVCQCVANPYSEIGVRGLQGLIQDFFVKNRKIKKIWKIKLKELITHRTKEKLKKQINRSKKVNKTKQDLVLIGNHSVTKIFPNHKRQSIQEWTKWIR